LTWREARGGRGRHTYIDAAGGLAAEHHVDGNVPVQRQREGFHPLKKSGRGLLVQDHIACDTAEMPEIAFGHARATGEAWRRAVVLPFCRLMFKGTAPPVWVGAVVLLKRLSTRTNSSRVAAALGGTVSQNG
jgi:hypothetical protein